MFNKALDHGLYQMGPIHTPSPCVGPYSHKTPQPMGFYPTGNVFISLDSLAITPNNVDNGQELFVR